MFRLLRLVGGSSFRPSSLPVITGYSQGRTYHSRNEISPEVKKYFDTFNSRNVIKFGLIILPSSFCGASLVFWSHSASAVLGLFLLMTSGIGIRFFTEYLRFIKSPHYQVIKNEKINAKDAEAILWHLRTVNLLSCVKLNRLLFSIHGPRSDK